MKYTYFKVIQQAYGQGWEDVSHYETNSQYVFKTKEEKLVFIHDLKEYRITGYPTRSIKRRELAKQETQEPTNEQLIKEFTAKAEEFQKAYSAIYQKFNRELKDFLEATDQTSYGYELNNLAENICDNLALDGAGILDRLNRKNPLTNKDATTKKIRKALGYY